MQLSLRANLLALLVPARRKIGFPRHLSKELHSVAVSERVALDDDPHVLEGFQAFARALGVPKCPPTWSIPIPAEDATWARDLYPEDARVLVICPAASAPERSWLAERYAAVADHAAAAGWSVVLTGGPSDCERQLAAAVQSHASQPIANLVGKTSLKALLALLQRADLLLAPDTGPAHMAVSQGTPVIGLYAHSNPARTGPYLFRDEVVSAYEQHVTAQQGKPLAAIKWGTRAKGDNLMTSIGVDEVIQAFDRVSEKLPAAGSTPARP
jgi:heptosyltransferase I